MREEDKKSISNSLRAMKADNNYTDIGAALRTALNYIVDLKGQNFDLYEPVVLFITDGDITTSPDSAFANKSVEKIFEDPVIGNTPLFDGWYFCGIGKNLHDLPKIAKLADREDYLFTIEDMDSLELKLDEWISSIPESKPLEQGSVDFTDFKIGGVKLLVKSYTNEKTKKVDQVLESELSTTVSKKESYSVVSTSEEKISFVISSSYEETPVVFKFVDAHATFQTDDRKSNSDVVINSEIGLIQLPPPLAKKDSTAAFLPDTPILGKGILKMDLVANINGLDKTYHIEFKIHGKTPQQILLEKILWPSISALCAIILFIVCWIMYKCRPHKIHFIVDGKEQRKGVVQVRIHQGYIIGSGGAYPFQIKKDEYDIPKICGIFKRTGFDKYEIIPDNKEGEKVFGTTSKFEYKLGTGLNISDRNENSLSIKWFKKSK